MAKLTNVKTGESIEVKDDIPLKEAVEELGVPFGCTEGICGTCMIDIVEGKENLTGLTEAEEDLDRDEEHRLACQCRIKHGEVKFEPF